MNAWARNWVVRTGRDFGALADMMAECTRKGRHGQRVALAEHVLAIHGEDFARLVAECWVARCVEAGV